MIKAVLGSLKNTCDEIMQALSKNRDLAKTVADNAGLEELLPEDFEYQWPSRFSVENLYLAKALASKLFWDHPSKWESLFYDYSFYGESVMPGFHVFKFKGYSTGIDEPDRYIEIPFSELFKSNPTEASKEMSTEEWSQAIGELRLTPAYAIWRVVVDALSC